MGAGENSLNNGIETTGVKSADGHVREESGGRGRRESVCREVS